MATIGRQLRDAVRARSNGQCEYCQLPDAFSDEPFWIDHVVAEQHGGATRFENLAFCCMRCNRQKGPNLAGRDPITNQLAFLFDPRKDTWNVHFEWASATLIGKTSVGRATVVALNMNHPARMSARAALVSEGVFPPAKI